jgi:hypothetical protein
VRDVVQEESRDRDVLEVLVTGRGSSHPAQLLTQLVVIGVVGEWDEGEEPAGVVLQPAQGFKVLHPVRRRLDVAIEHGAVGGDAELVGERGAPEATPAR